MARSTSTSLRKNKKDDTRLVLLDVHAILHRAYHALPDFSTSSGHPTGALYGLCTILIKLINDLQPDYLMACYDLPEPTHRSQLYDGYKAGRARSDEELVDQIQRSRQVFEALAIPIYEQPGFEADDILGTIVAQLSDRPGLEIIIASGDMDTMQLVADDRVKVYTMKRGLKETVLYNEQAVRERFGFAPEHLPDFKGLSGDPSDNIPGIQGIGDKTATQLIQAAGSLKDIYRALEEEPEKLSRAGVKDRAQKLLAEGKEEAEFSKMLATIRLDADIKPELPSESWGKQLDLSAIEELFREFEFRSLGSRLREALGYEIEETDGQGGAGEADPAASVSKQDRKELPIMLWVYDSNLTTPSLEDVFTATGTREPAAARQVLEDRLREREVMEVYSRIEKPIIPVVEAMSERGVLIDQAYLGDLSARYHQELEKLEQKIHQAAGREFNVNSPQQLAQVLFQDLGLSVKNHKKTSTGQLSTAESELQKLTGEHPIVELILEHRELAKLLSSYIDAIPPLLDQDSRLHARFLQAGTTTGRMASSDPNLQNIPIRSEHGQVIRDAFVAAPGFRLLALDYSQIELRVAAFLSGDQKLIETFQHRRDIHTAVAAEVFEVEPEKVDKEMRRQAKVINFGILYGMGVQALQRNLETDRREAQQFYNQYFAKFPGLADYIDEVKRTAYERGYTKTFFGRRRYFQGLDSSLPQVRASAERMAINAPIQGTAADILKIAMRDIDQWVKEQGSGDSVRPLIQIHDELIFEVAEEGLESSALEIKRLMEGVLPPERVSGVELLVEAEAGKNWGQMEVLTIDN